MILLQLFCLAIVAIYVGARLARARKKEEKVVFLARFAAIGTAAAIGEDTIIRAYHTYSYAPSWSVFIDKVPLVVILVWPVVIDSAASLARHVARTPMRIALLTAAIVLADASLIEPIAVRAGLWSWTDPGVFDVPLVGIAGWAIFTFAATLIGGADRKAGESAKPILERTKNLIAMIAIAPLATHAIILASWWMLFRWIQGSIAPTITVIAAWIVLAGVSISARRIAAKIPVAEILLRAPGAAFFFALLLLQRPDTSLLAYAIAFAPPYLVCLVVSVLRHENQAARLAKPN